MAWKEQKKMDLRYALAKQFATGEFSKVELAEIYNISRPTVDKWLKRYDLEGAGGLLDRSRRPHSSPIQTPHEVIDLILTMNKKKGWMAKKLMTHLKIKYPQFDTPARSTIHGILEKHNRVCKRPRRSHYKHPGKPFVNPTASGEIWSMDFKGEFSLGNGSRCYPLTITDNYSRFLITVSGFHSPKYEPTRKAMERAFSEYGLPRAILTDNGAPFSSKAIGRLSRLSAWWIRLGVKPILTQPSSPQQNGKHERMHKELKRLTTRPPGYNMQVQQRKFNEFIHDYNFELGHGGIEDRLPSSLFQHTNRPFLKEKKGFSYPEHFEKRLISANGGFRWGHERIPLTTTLEGEYVGLEEINDYLWKVFYRDFFLGVFDERLKKVEDAPDNFDRRCK